ncbi:MAG: YIP1 family protein [Syntrophomonadaceae bacterium]|nr:YIP1 family protein [Syntrophomonadaceae bacterium]
MPITDMLYGVLFRPVATFGRLAEEKPLARAVGVWSLALVFTALVNAGIFRGQLGSALPFPALTQAASNLMWLYGLMYVLFSLALWFVISAVYTVLGELLFGVANGRGILTCMALAGVPAAFGPAFYLLGEVLSLQSLSWLLMLGVSLWTLVLKILALRETLDIDTARAVVIWILPYLAAALPVILGVIVVIASIGTL